MDRTVQRTNEKGKGQVAQIIRLTCYENSGAAVIASAHSLASCDNGGRRKEKVHYSRTALFWSK